MHGADGGDELVDGLALIDAARTAGFEGAEEQGVVLRLREQDDRGPRDEIEDAARDLGAVTLRQPDVQDHDVGGEPGGALDPLGSGASDPDHVDPGIEP